MATEIRGHFSVAGGSPSQQQKLAVLSVEVVKTPILFQTLSLCPVRVVRHHVMSWKRRDGRSLTPLIQYILRQRTEHPDWLEVIAKRLSTQDRSAGGIRLCIGDQLLSTPEAFGGPCVYMHTYILPIPQVTVVKVRNFAVSDCVDWTRDWTSCTIIKLDSWFFTWSLVAAYVMKLKFLFACIIPRLSAVIDMLNFQVPSHPISHFLQQPLQPHQV